MGEEESINFFGRLADKVRNQRAKQLLREMAAESRRNFEVLEDVYHGETLKEEVQLSMDKAVGVALKHHIGNEKNIMKLYNTLMENSSLKYEMKLTFAKLVADKKRQIDVATILASLAEEKRRVTETPERFV